MLIVPTLLLGMSGLACSDDGGAGSSSETSTETTAGDGDGDPAGDGDGDVGDGDGDVGDGDGDVGDGDGDVGDGDGDVGDGDGDVGDGDGDVGDGDGDVGDGDGDVGDGDGDPDVDVCGDAMVTGAEICDDGINDGGYGGCNDDCLSLAPNCGDGEVNGPEICDDANDDNADGCLGSCTVPANCLEILDYDDQSTDGIYMIDADADGDAAMFSVTCDMTTDGGGWTMCGNIDETGLGIDVCVTESLTVEDESDLVNLSFCQVMYELQPTTAMLIHNRTPDGNEDYGFDDKVAITWGDSPFTINTYDNHPIEDCRNLTTDTVWADCQYSSHSGNPWQSAVWSFTVGAMNNGYSGNGNRRLTLGPTFQNGTEGCTWHNFGADTNPRNVANAWRVTENIGDMYLR